MVPVFVCVAEPSSAGVFSVFPAVFLVTSSPEAAGLSLPEREARINGTATAVATSNTTTEQAIVAISFCRRVANSPACFVVPCGWSACESAGGGDCSGWESCTDGGLGAGAMLIDGSPSKLNSPDESEARRSGSRFGFRGGGRH